VGMSDLTDLTDRYTILNSDVMDGLAECWDEMFDCVVTSPPYWRLRDYEQNSRQIGQEQTPEDYVAKLTSVFREVRRTLRDDGTFWLNIGDCYAAGGQNSGSTPDALTDKQRSNVGCRYERTLPPDVYKVKDLVGIPWMLAFALRKDGWYLRSDIIWSKPNPMPESVKDRPTRSHEYLFLLTKSPSYYYDHASMQEPAVSTSVKKFTDNGKDKQRGHGRRHEGFNGRYADRLAESGIPTTRNRRDVWSVATSPYPDAHFATFPPSLIRPCILAGCPPDGLVLDPFAGSGTTLQVALEEGRRAVGIELNTSYCVMIEERMDKLSARTRTRTG
jgi:DNA modification methylase